MNLKKFFATAAAVLISAAAFAGNSSDTKVLIEQFFKVPEIQKVGELDPEQQLAINTMQALRDGLLVYEANLTANTMTEKDKAIDAALNEKIPAVLNKIKESSDEVYEELYPLLQQTANDIFANQTAYNKSQVDMEENAPVLIWMFSYLKAEHDGVLLGRASRVLATEMMQMMAGAVQE
ncbi:MAG: hypothetical protein ACI37O_07865 [Candidatus Avelusimicrobium sp.]|uniref:hypothetical protein n=1 Tax=Candidatus Avelusimicrobium sp. TaxID=3048833 RepID=UPI003F088EAF